VVHLVEVHYWHLLAQGLHLESTIVKPGAQEVHLVILLVVQFEQEVAHPEQIPLMRINPLLQAKQVSLPSQVTQFLGHATQVLFTKRCLAWHLRQLSAVPSQLLHFLSQGKQVLLADR